MPMMEMEDYCVVCDATVRAVCDEGAFWAHRTGRIKCPECGADVMPCNECAAETPLEDRDCENCPWRGAEQYAWPVDEDKPAKPDEVDDPRGPDDFIWGDVLDPGEFC